MRKFIVKVNGSSYEVEVEEVNNNKNAGTSGINPDTSGSDPNRANGAANNSAATSAVSAAGTTVTAPQASEPGAEIRAAQQKNSPTGISPGEGIQVKAPMPGTIVKIQVHQGNSVKKGQVLLVLEAMKMENEIVSPVAGTVGTVVVSKGSSVNAGEILITII